MAVLVRDWLFAGVNLDWGMGRIFWGDLSRVASMMTEL